MYDDKMTKDQLLKEVAKLEARISELEAQQERLLGFADFSGFDAINALSILNGAAQLLVEEPVSLEPGERRKLIALVEHSGEHIAYTLNQLRLWASVQRAESVDLISLDMKSIFADARRHLDALLARHKTQLLTLEHWPSVQGNPFWVMWVWVVLLRNAIRRSGQGGRIEVGATMQPTHVCYWMRDYGPALSFEEQARLFTPFDEPSMKFVSGDDLGLVLVRRIIDIFGGQVGARTGVNDQGNIFYFTLRRVKE